MAVAKIVLAPNVYKTIEYFTKNLNTEIGAVGTGSIRTEDKEKYFYIDKLYFPDQNVTGATVNFKPEHWGSIIKQMPKEDLGKICFYWHRHPGSAAHSHTDEEDTFNVFMDKESGRKYFVFMQTAWKGTEMEFESRIDLAVPVRATIFDKDIEVIEEMNEKESGLADEVSVAEEKLKTYREELNEKVKKNCDELASKCILKPAPTVYSWAKNTKPINKSWTKSFQNLNGKKDHPFWKEVPDRLRNELTTNFNVEPENSYVDNDIIPNFITSIEEKASIKCENGCLVIKAGKLFNKVMVNSLSKKGILHDMVKRTKFKEEGTMTHYLLTPGKKQYQELKIACLNLFLSFNTLLEKKIEKDTVTSNIKGEDIVSGHTISNKKAIDEFFEMIYQSFAVVWIQEPTFAQVLDMETEDLLGNVYVSDDMSKMTITGDELISFAVGIENWAEGCDTTKAVADKTTIESKVEEGVKCKKK